MRPFGAVAASALPARAATVAATRTATVSTPAARRAAKGYERMALTPPVKVRGTAKSAGSSARGPTHAAILRSPYGARSQASTTEGPPPEGSKVLPVELPRQERASV